MKSKVVDFNNNYNVFFKKIGFRFISNEEFGNVKESGETTLGDISKFINKNINPREYSPYWQAKYQVYSGDHKEKNYIDFKIDYEEPVSGDFLQEGKPSKLTLEFFYNK